jgi:aerobic-type carbon monoxide dehydrogenase small subunit (CoxS/CutS family)
MTHDEETTRCLEGPGPVVLHVNGEDRHVVVNASATLLDVLRSTLGLTGAKPGCENGDCGACTVVVDGLPRKSCLMLAVEAEGRAVETVEGLNRHPMQEAFLEEWAFQCGYCTSGFLMVARAMSDRPELADHPDEMTEWLRSNICRCTGYQEITEAVRKGLSRVQEKGEPSPERSRAPVVVGAGRDSAGTRTRRI